MKYLTYHVKDDEKALYIVMEFCGQGSLSGDNNFAFYFDAFPTALLQIH